MYIPRQRSVSFQKTNTFVKDAELEQFSKNLEQKILKDFDVQANINLPEFVERIRIELLQAMHQEYTHAVVINNQNKVRLLLV